jgi:multicomponent Na+:H+ antiporter subunit D
MIEQHLPILQIIVPLIAAPLSAFCRRPALTWHLTLLVCATTFAISVILLSKVLDGGHISYTLGGWAAPFGIEYRVDAVNAFVLVIISAIGVAVMPYARTSLADELEPHNQVLFYTAYLLCLTGLLGIVITGDAFNAFVFLEISSLATYALVALGAGKDRRALTAAYSYLVMGTIGATFFVIGVGLIYMMTGTLNMADLAQRLQGLEQNRTVLTAFGFIVTGLGLKLALFPLHLWLPNAYAFAPSVVTVFLAATATKAAIYLLIRFMFTVFGTDYNMLGLTLTWLFTPLALAAMFAASTVAIFQIDIKRMLAYSSVAQVGYMVLGLSFVSVMGLTATMLHVFNHALMKGALFMAVGAIVLRKGLASIESVRGLGRKMPWTMAAFVGGGLSLIGVPLTVGFISKWYLITASLESGRWPIALLIVASSLLAVIYIWRVVEAAYLEDASDDAPVREAPLSMLIPTWGLIGANVYFGIDANLTITAANTAARILLGVMP